MLYLQSENDKTNVTTCYIMYNFDVRISVYSSAFDHTGSDMSLADFMRLGKEQYYGDIIAYRTLKASIRELKDAREGYLSEQEELSQYIRENENPFGGEDTPEVVKAKDELDKAQANLVQIEGQINKASKQADWYKRKLPCATLSGRFAPTRAKSNLVQHSGFICVDIDDHYEERDSRGEMRSYTQNMAGVPELLSQLPFVLYASHSVGGVGYFALIPLGPIDEEHNHEWYFDRLKEEFQLYGVVIDRACRDVTRLRFCSYDANPIRNAQAEPFLGQHKFVSRNERKRQEEESRRQALIAQVKARRQTTDDSANDYERVGICVRKCQQRNINLTEQYENWKEVGFALATAFGERGRDYFHALSAISTKYDYTENNRKYDNFLRTTQNKYTLGTLFALFKQNGVFWYKD